MSTQRYTHVQELLPEIETMIQEGKTQREIEEHFGFKSKDAVKQLLKRERSKQKKNGCWDSFRYPEVATTVL